MSAFEITSRLGPSHADEPRATTRLELATLPAYQASLDCVHCGFCLQSCATYQVTGLEPSSPRGRIVLMKAFAEGRITLEGESARHLDDCIGCRACEPVCPAGVRYGEMLEVVREARSERAAAAATAAPATVATRLRDLALDWLPHRTATRLVANTLRLYRRSGVAALAHRRGWIASLPPALRMMEGLVPAQLAPPLRTSTVAVRMEARRAASTTAPRTRVALFRGCIGDALFPDVNQAAAALLDLYGFDVVPVPDQTCCGALDLHAGRSGRALALVRRNLDAFEEAGLGAPGGIELVASTAAGCGAMLRDLSRHFDDAPGVRAAAKRFEVRVRDVTELLAGGTPRAAPGPLRASATYHPPCHLHHAQRVTEAPLALLRTIPELTLVPLERAELCCGSGGLYNVLRPAMADRVLDDKLAAIDATGASLLVTGNPGCHLHIAAGLRARGREVRVVHPLSLLALAHGVAPRQASSS
ncbi:MAG: heterodisulfide reductase-related iron-sulfur binding cluster [bacterium]